MQSQLFTVVSEALGDLPTPHLPLFYSSSPLQPTGPSAPNILPRMLFSQIAAWLHLCFLQIAASLALYQRGRPRPGCVWWVHHPAGTPPLPQARECSTRHSSWICICFVPCCVLSIYSCARHVYWARWIHVKSWVGMFQNDLESGIVRKAWLT